MLKATIGILFEEGLPAFTIDEVARRSGVAKTTIYRHYPSRNDLILAALEQAITPPAIPDAGSLRADLREFLPNVAPIFGNQRFRALSHELSAAAIRDPDFPDVAATFFHGRMGPLHTIYVRAVERGEIDPSIDFESAIELIEGPLIVLSMLRPEALDDLDAEALIDRIEAQLALVGSPQVAPG